MKAHHVTVFVQSLFVDRLQGDARSGWAELACMVFRPANALIKAS